MHLVAAILGAVLVVAVLVDGFRTIVLPRRVKGRFGPTRAFFLATWRAWAWAARFLPGAADRGGRSARDQFLGVYGPLALVLLIGLWAATLVLGFALLLWGSRAELLGPGDRPPGFGTTLYASGVTLFTIGFGDVTPQNGLAQALTVVEGAVGLSFLAAIISYLPVMFAAFSEREESIILLDARAGSPPTAGELLRRLGRDGGGALEAHLREWEAWSARLLETHLSYPFLAFFRSQHEHQSWLAALTMILDTCALVLVGVGEGGGAARHQARLTFATARHAAGDLSEALDAAPHSPEPDRLPPGELARLCAALAGAGLPLRTGAEAERRLAALRALYEPHVVATASRILMPLPPWLPEAGAEDDWATTEWREDPEAAQAIVAGAAESEAAGRRG